MKVFTRFLCWLRWKLGLRPPWVNLPPLDPWSATEHGEHKMDAVSRHAIAETGLICPRCLNEICTQGDYTKVREGKIGKYRNEVVICDGTRHVNDQKMQCGGILIASPDTEHGDDILWDKVQEKDREALFFRFRRIREEQMIKDKYGLDVTKKEGYLTTNKENAKEAVKEDKPRLVFEVEEVYSLSNTKLGRVTEVLKEHAGDSYFAGWAVMEIDGDGKRWFVNPHGVVRCDMTDPTLNNLHVVAKQQKV